MAASTITLPAFSAPSSTLPASKTDAFKLAQAELVKTVSDSAGTKKFTAGRFQSVWLVDIKDSEGSLLEHKLGKY